MFCCRSAKHCKRVWMGFSVKCYLAFFFKCLVLKFVKKLTVKC